VSDAPSERLPAPIDPADLDNTILPSRALLLSVRDTLCKARRGSIDDAVREARRLAGRNGPPSDEAGIAALAVLWEAVACLELAANVAAPWVDPQRASPHGPWFEMTFYQGSRANRFYESSHRWTDERFSVLSGHRFRHGDDTSMLDILRSEAAALDDRIPKLFAEAEAATTKFLRERFQDLARAWKQMRPYAVAFEHGLLHVPSSVGAIVDEDEVELPQAFVVWDTRGDHSRGEDEQSLLSAIDTGEAAGGLALDLAYHVADSRLRLVEALEFTDGQVYLRPWSDPIPFWFSRGDVPDETVALLENISLNWVRVEPEPER
jgi:hypothetical protein